MALRDRVAGWVDAMSRLPDTPERLALAFGVGVFLGFSPFLGLQTILGLFFAYLLGWSRLAVIAGTWVNLPWLVPAYYVLVTEGGARLLGLEPPSRLSEEIGAVLSSSGIGLNSIRRVIVLLQPMLWPFVVGSTMGALVLGITANRVVLLLLRARRVDPLPRATGE
jgi:uncharacterized protein (DUF2062 family)